VLGEMTHKLVSLGTPDSLAVSETPDDNDQRRDTFTSGCA
jgi:hypothetical protein